MGKIKKIRTEKFRSALKDLSKAAYNAELTFQKLSEAVAVLSKSTQKWKRSDIKRLGLSGRAGSAAGRELRQKFLKDAAPV